MAATTVTMYEAMGGVPVVEPLGTPMVESRKGVVQTEAMRAAVSAAAVASLLESAPGQIYVATPGRAPALAGGTTAGVPAAALWPCTRAGKLRLGTRVNMPCFLKLERAKMLPRVVCFQAITLPRTRSLGALAKGGMSV